MYICTLNITAKRDTPQNHLFTQNYGGIYMPDNQQQESDAVKIAHDKEKTKRYTIYIGAFVLIALVGIILVFNATGDGNRKFDLNMKEMKLSVSVDRPIVEQAKQPTTSYNTPKGDVKFTTGTLNPSIISQLEADNVQFSPTSFSGKNFVNKSAGFLFSIEHPERWQVAYTPNNIVLSATRINDFTSGDNNMNVVVEQLSSVMDIVSYTQASLQNSLSLGYISEMPEVEYDRNSQTSFYGFYNHTGGYTIQKCVVKGNRGYVATANFSATSSDEISIADMLLMISTFTLLG
jgi:hypothetical protein